MSTLLLLPLGDLLCRSAAGEVRERVSIFLIGEENQGRHIYMKASCQVDEMS